MKNFKKFVLILLVLFLITISGILFLYALFSKPSSPFLRWNDIYNYYPLESSVDLIFEKLPKHNQFIVTDDYIIAVIDLYEDRGVDAQAEHLLFYGKDLKLKYAYFIPMVLDSIANNTLYGGYYDSVEYKRYEKRTSTYRSDLPPNYSIHQRVEPGKRKLRFATSYTFLDVNMEEFPMISMKLNEYTTNKYYIGNLVIVPYPLKTYGNEGYIYATRISNNGELIEDRIDIMDKDKLDKYYKELYEKIQEWSKK